MPPKSVCLFALRALVHECACALVYIFRALTPLFSLHTTTVFASSCNHFWGCSRDNPSTTSCAHCARLRPGPLKSPSTVLGVPPWPSCEVYCRISFSSILSNMHKENKTTEMSIARRGKMKEKRMHGKKYYRKIKKCK